MKKLYYVANIRLPTGKAHGIQIMEMCQAFADQGVSVELIVPRRFNRIKEDPFVYHDVRRNFTVRKLPCIDLIRFGKFGFWIELVTFTLAVGWFALFESKGIFFTRDEVVALSLKIMGKKVGWEAHMGHQNIVIKTLVKMHLPIVTITDGLRDLYISTGATPADVITAIDGADIDRFDVDISQKDARNRLGLPLDKKIILHKGHLYEYVGVNDLARSMSLIQHKDALCVFIGGTEKNNESFKEKFGKMENILILGNRPRPETPIYQKAADILVIPNSAKTDRTKFYASPLKLFGYMASRVPIIASDLPSIREVLDESMATFAEPDNPESLANAIDKVLDNPEKSKRKAEKAFVMVQGYTWKERARKILEFLS